MNDLIKGALLVVDRLQDEKKICNADASCLRTALNSVAGETSYTANAVNVISENRQEVSWETPVRDFLIKSINDEKEKAKKHDALWDVGVPLAGIVNGIEQRIGKDVEIQPEMLYEYVKEIAETCGVEITIISKNDEPYFVFHGAEQD